MRNYVFSGRPLGLVSSRQPSHAPRTPQKECVFCEIARGGGKSRNQLVLSTEKLVVFDDHRPAATRHFLVCPKEHIDGLYDLEGEGEDLELLDEMIRVGEKVVLEAAAAEARATTTTSTSSSSASASTSASASPAPPPRIKLGFHIPPWNSVDHLHLHAFLLPHSGGVGQRIRFAETPGGTPRLWYASAAQVRSFLVRRSDEQRKKEEAKKAAAEGGGGAK